MPGHQNRFELHDDYHARINDPGDAGDISVDRNLFIVELTSGSSDETRTLKDPTAPGVFGVIQLKTDGGGNITVTADSAMDAAGTTSFVLRDANDKIPVYSIEDGSETFAWQFFPGHESSVPDVGGLVNVGDVATYSVLAANSGKLHVIPGLTADCVLSMPTAEDGLDFEFIYGGVAADAQDWQFDTGSDTNFYLGGLVHLDADAGSGGDEVVPVGPDGNSNSKVNILVPDVGTRVRLACDGTNWFLQGQVVGATAPTYADQ